jgi:hypothetical protein
VQTNYREELLLELSAGMSSWLRSFGPLVVDPLVVDLSRCLPASGLTGLVSPSPVPAAVGSRFEIVPVDHESFFEPFTAGSFTEGFVPEAVWLSSERAREESLLRSEELRSLSRVRPLEFIEEPLSVPVAAAEFDEVVSSLIEPPLRVEPFMLLFELLLPEFQSDELEPRLVFPAAAAPVELLTSPEVVVPLLLVPATLVSFGSVSVELEEALVPVREPVVEVEEEDDGVGEVVFAFGLPTCELVDCAPAEPATSAPASKIAEQA